MVALHNLHCNFLFSCQRICKQYIILNQVFFWYKIILNPLHTIPFWLNIVLDVLKLKITQTHIPHNYTSQIVFFVRLMLWEPVEKSGYQHAPLTNWTHIKIVLVLFTFSVRVNNPWPNAIWFVSVEVQNCDLVSLIVLVPQWMLKWSKRVSLMSVSFTNYLTSHHPQLSIFSHVYKFNASPNITIYKGYKIKCTQHLHMSYLTKLKKWSKIH